MKPRTKLQKQVAELSSKLPAITEKQRQWAIDNCFERKGYLRKNTVWCTECGNTWLAGESELATQLLGVECPHCHSSLKVSRSQKRKDEVKEYYTIVTTCNGFQVLRHYIAMKSCKVGFAARYDVDEAVQNWITPDGSDEIMARMTRQSIFYIDLWDWSSPLTNKGSIENVHVSDKYNVFANHIYPVRRIIPELRRNGFKGHFHSVCPLSLFKHLLRDSRTETLIKARQYALLGYSISHSLRELWPSIRICIRNKYIIKDASMWRDYLGFLNYFGMDTHNAKYVCPENLKGAHDLWMKKKNKVEAKRKEEERRKEAAVADAEYKKLKSKFFDICISDGVIAIGVLKSVQEFLEEGESMHHCVFSGGYYEKKDSLVLSAHIGDKRIETIELSLKTLEIIQSRGICNKNTEYHDRIIGLVKQNIHLIRQKMAS